MTKYYRENYLIPAVIVHGRQIESYRSPINKLENMVMNFEGFFGDIPLADFKYEMIRKYAIRLSKNPKKTVNATEQWRPTNPCV